MKVLKIIALLLLAATGLAQAQEVTVKGNTKLNTDFSKYKTFTWANIDATAQPESGYYIYSYSEQPIVTVQSKDKNGKTVTTQVPTPYAYSYNVIIPASNAVVNASVKSALQEELEARGYRESPTKGDLLVLYRVLEKKARMKGYIDDNPTVISTREVRTPSDTTTHVVEPGTLIISLIDSKTSENVWDGFASGLVKENTFIADENKIKEAVHLIMEEFKYRGDKVTKK